MRDDDRRRATGHRVLFDREREPEAWYLAAHYLKRLSPERIHQLRILAECMLMEDDIAAMSSASAVRH